MDVATIRKRLYLENELGYSVSDDLLLLAFTPPPVDWRNYSNKTDRYKAMRISNKSINYRTLEAYGDRVLNFIITNLIMEDYGLDVPPSLIPAYEKMLGNNMTLTRIMTELLICYQAYPDININDKHNPCANSFEAVLGALYYSNYTNIDGIKLIYNWYVSLPPVRRIRTLLQEQYKGNSLKAEEMYQALLDDNLDDDIAYAMSVTTDDPFNWGYPIIVISKRSMKYTDILNQVSYLMKVSPILDRELELRKVDVGPTTFISFEETDEDAAQDLLSQLVRQNFIIIIDDGGPYIEGSIPVKYYSKFYRVPRLPYSRSRSPFIVV